MQEVILGIDCGTSKIAIALIEPESGKVLDVRPAVIHAELPGTAPARAEQDVAAIASVFRQALSEMLTVHRVRLLSIGLTGQAHGILGLDQSGKPITPFVTWQDRRGEEEIRPGLTLLQEMRQTGITKPLATGYGVVTLYDWLKRGFPVDLSRICNIVDYLGVLLTENPNPVMDYTMAESTGMFDPAGDWDRELLEALAIPATVLPRLSPPTEIADVLKSSWLLEMGNNPEVPVCVGIADNQAGYLGSVRRPFRSLLINIGTGSQISVAIRDPDEALGSVDGLNVTLRPFVDSALLVAGSALAGGAAYRALKDFFAAAGRELFGVEEPSDLYERMADLAERTGPADELFIDPLFSGSRSRPNERGRIEGLSFDNLRPGAFVYGVLKGLIRVLRDLVDPRLIADREYLVGSGNGFRRNPLLGKIAAAVFGRPLLIPQIAEEAAVGAALNGAVAAGIFKDFEEARELIRYGDQQMQRREH